MLTYISGSDTAVVVLHEIYGINNHIINVCEDLSNYKFDVIAPNMLNRTDSFHYDQECIAYNHFMNHIGFERAVNQIKPILCSLRLQYKKIYIIGYSVGATIAWLCSETGFCDAVIGFYGSRIRNYIEIVPKCPVLLLYPSQEESFEVSGLISILSEKENVEVKMISGKHGFADSFSKNYNEKSFIEAHTELVSFIQQL